MLEPMENDLESVEMARPMHLLARDCSDLFGTILDGYVNDSDTMESHEPREEVVQAQRKGLEQIISKMMEYDSAFTAWASFVCVFAAPDTCLDHRLRKHPSVRDIIIRLLELLRQNLYFVSCSLLDQQHEPDMLSEVSLSLTGIEDSMKSLNKLALTIRQSSRSTVLTLARNFATSNCALDDLEDLVLTALEALYPNATESLRNHLCNTMTDRYAKIEYDAHRRGNPRAQRFRHPEMTTKQGKAQATTQTRINSPVRRGRQQETQGIDQERQRMPPSTVDTAQLAKNLGIQHKSIKPSRAHLSVYKSRTHLHEPTPPQFKSDATHTECEWCGELLDRSMLNDNGWLEPGRVHYRHDLKPWPCLSEECGESRPSFSSRTEFFEHMRSKHSPVWTQFPHERQMWVCNDHDENSTPYTFSSKSELEKHMLIQHPSNPPFLDCNTSDSMEPKLLFNAAPSLDKCPLCWYFDEDKVKKTRVSSSGEDVSASSRASKGNGEPPSNRRTGLTSSDDVRYELDNSNHQTPEREPNEPSKLELHISGHLQYLTALSLRLAATLNLGPDLDFEDGGSHATRSTSKKREDLNPDELSEDGSTLPYLSEDEINLLEHTRLEREYDTSTLFETNESWTPAILVNSLPANNETTILPHGYTYEGDGLVPISGAQDDLEHLLREYEIEGIDGPFWTNKLLRHILTRERIKAELQSPEYHLSGRQVSDYVDKIHPSSELTSSNVYLRVFAILVLIDHPSKIGTFIDQGFCDQKLPIVTKRGRVYLLSDTEEFLPCFDNWRMMWIDHFEQMQWRVNTPYFSPTQGRVPDEFCLSPQTRRPWRRSTNHGTESLEAYGTVTSVDIHPTAHSYQQLLTGINLNCTGFAIKTLHTMDTSNKKKFRAEWDRLKAFSGPAHEHLVAILGVFTQGNKLSFIFPNAYCNLNQYLETYEAPQGWKGACWFAKQLSGLIGALDAIHNPKQLSQDSTKRSRWHGDIRRDNILCFEKSGTSHEMIFVISDLSLTLSHRDRSRSNSPNRQAPPVPGYRPPECDIEGGTITSAFDIWTLGCLFLDLITWFLGGYKTLENSERKRTTLYISGAYNDIFFTLKRSQTDETYIAQVKPEVTEWFHELRSHPKCSEFLHDALDIIENKMLVVLSDGRSPSKDLRKSFQSLYSICMKSNHFTQGKPWGDAQVRRAQERMAADNAAVEVFPNAYAEALIRELSFTVPVHTGERKNSLRPEELKRLDG